MNQHYFDVPFAFAGDVTAIPDPLQVGGTVSMTEGWNFNYQRNLSTDPAALPIDRSTMNWLLLQISTAIQALQQSGVPEFINSSQNGGVAFSYGKGAVVLWSASGNAPFGKYVNLNAGNTNTPSAGDPQGLTTGWQIEVDPIATAAQATAGTDDASIMTPLKVAQQVALRALLAGNSAQVFNVGPATALTHAPEAGQVQQQGFNYAGVAGGTANALTATLAPAPTAYTDDLVVVLRIASNNTGAVTLNVNGLGVKNVVGGAQAALVGGELAATGMAVFRYSTALGNFVLEWSSGGAQQISPGVAGGHAATMNQAGFQNCAVYINVGGTQQVSINGGAFTTTGATTAPIPVSGRLGWRAWSGGGGSGGTNLSNSAAAGGGGGAYAEGVFTGITTALAIACGLGGTAGVGGASATGGGNGGSTTIGGLVSLTGGVGGLAASGGTQGTISAGGTVTAPAGCFAVPGGTSDQPVLLPGSTTSMVARGGAAFGSPVPHIGFASASAAGIPGIFPGGGATGSANQANGAAGANGCVILYY